MSAFVVSKEHVDAIVEVALHGPTDTGPVSPDTVWHGVSWYSEDPREISKRVDSHEEYWAELSKAHKQTRDYGIADGLGDMLVRECVRSVSHRYSDNDDLPGPVDAYYLEPYHYSRGKRLTAVEALKAVDCFEYQSCEHPEWETSEAHAFCESLRSSLIGSLPGYDEAAWEIYAERV